MKKILLALLLLTIVAVSGSFKETKTACDNNDMKSCYNLGIMYLTGKGIDKDSSKAITLFLDACKKKEGSCCGLIGSLYADGVIGGKPDNQNAANFFKAACDYGDMHSCASIAFLYKNGKGVKKDLAMSAKLDKKACEGGYPMACHNLGRSYYFGEGVEKDYNMAAKYWLKAMSEGEIIEAGSSLVTLCMKNPNIKLCKELQ